MRRAQHTDMEVPDEYADDAEFHHAAGVEFAAAASWKRAQLHFQRAAELSPASSNARAVALDALLYCRRQQENQVQNDDEDEEEEEEGEYVHDDDDVSGDDDDHDAYSDYDDQPWPEASRHQWQQHVQQQQQRQQQQRQQHEEQRFEPARDSPPLSASLRARIHAARRVRTAATESAQHHHHRRRAAEQEDAARQHAASQQNREAAAAFFEKCQDAVQASDLHTALRRVRRAIDLHPAQDDGSDLTAETYLEWEAAICEAMEEEARDDEEERRREQEEAEVEERRQRKAERARKKREAEDQRERERREKDDARARRAARQKANRDAAAEYAEAARTARDPSQRVRFMRKAVALQGFVVSYRVRLLQAHLTARCTDTCTALTKSWHARGALYGHVGVAATLFVGFIVARGLLRGVSRRMMSGRRCRAGASSADGLCVAGRALEEAIDRWATLTQWQGPRALHPAVVLFIVLPALLACMLPSASFQRMGDWNALAAHVMGYAQAGWAKAKALIAAINKQIEDWERDAEERERAARRRRQQARAEHDPYSHARRQQQQQQQRANWEWEDYGHQHYGRQQQRQQRDRWEREHHQYRSPRPPPPSEVNQVRERARRLPAGEVRRVLLSSTHYEALQVPRTASGGEAKKAFHKLALRLHPDKCKQEMAEEAFKRIEEASRTLTDARLRKEYDLTLPVPAPYGATSQSRNSAMPAGGRRSTYHAKWE